MRHTPRCSQRRPEVLRRVAMHDDEGRERHHREREEDSHRQRQLARVEIPDHPSPLVERRQDFPLTIDEILANKVWVLCAIL